jgi:hypothetical protein
MRNPGPATGIDGLPLLDPGEQALWRGGPDPKVLFVPGDAFIVPFSVLWAGFSFFWEGTLASTRHPPLPMLIFGAAFNAVGLYLLVGRFFYKRFDRRRTTYVLTNRRAAVVRNRGRQVISTSIGAPSLVQWRRDRRHGTSGRRRSRFQDVDTGGAATPAAKPRGSAVPAGPCQRIPVKWRSLT